MPRNFWYRLLTIWGGGGGHAATTVTNMEGGRWCPRADTDSRAVESMPHEGDATTED